MVVDLQNDFIDGSLAVPGADAIVPEVKALVGDYDRVIFTLDWHPGNHCSFKEQGGPWPAHCVSGSDGAQIAPGVLAAVPEGRFAFLMKGEDAEREEYGAFSGAAYEYEGLLSDAAQVDVCGIAAEYCVLETVKNLVRLAGDYGFGLSVLLHATASFSHHETLTAYLDSLSEAK